MELIAELEYPYSSEERFRFIASYQPRGYQIVKAENNNLQVFEISQEDIEEKEHARIQALSMTRSDFFDNTIKAFGMDEADFRPVVENILTVLGVDNIARKIALNNYENALNFYRKHTIFTLLSGVEIPLGETLKVKIEAEQWDRFFDQADKRNEEAYKILQEGIEEVSNSEE